MEDGENTLFMINVTFIEGFPNSGVKSLFFLGGGLTNIAFDHGVSNNKNKINCKREIMGSFRTHATSIL